MGRYATLKQEREQQEAEISAVLAPHLENSPVIVKTSSFYVNKGTARFAFPYTCQLTVYGSTEMVGPFDESSIINFLFPLTDKNSSVQCCFHGANNEWPEGYATMSEFHKPSMGIYVGERAFEVAWIGRIEYHNLMHKFEFQVHVVLTI